MNEGELLTKYKIIVEDDIRIDLKHLLYKTDIIGGFLIAIILIHVWKGFWFIIKRWL